MAFAGIAAGIGAGLGGVNAFGKLAEGASQGSLQAIGNAVARGALTSAATQGVGRITGLQSKFSWAGVAAAGIGAGISQAVGANIGGGQVANFAASSAASAIANAATRSAINGESFGANLIAAIPDVIAGILARAVGTAFDGVSSPAKAGTEDPVGGGGDISSLPEKFGGKPSRFKQQLEGSSHATSPTGRFDKFRTPIVNYENVDDLYGMLQENEKIGYKSEAHRAYVERAIYANIERFQRDTITPMLVDSLSVYVIDESEIFKVSALDQSALENVVNSYSERYEWQREPLRLNDVAQQNISQTYERRISAAEQRGGIGSYVQSSFAAVDYGAGTLLNGLSRTAISPWYSAAEGFDALLMSNQIPARVHVDTFANSSGQRRLGAVISGATQMAGAVLLTKSVKGAPRTGQVAAESVPLKFVPNPYGKLGGPAHQGAVADTIAGIQARGLRAETELFVRTPNGVKNSRFVDVVAYDRSGNIVEYYQIGKQTGAGLPIAREARAINDIQRVTIRPITFVPYNKVGK